MESTQKNRDNIKKRSIFSTIISGDFLLNKKVTIWYPYILMLIILAAITIGNERRIKKQLNTISEKEKEYQLILEEINISNAYIDYENKQILKEYAKTKGFVDNKGKKKIEIEKVEEKNNVR